MGEEWEVERGEWRAYMTLRSGILGAYGKRAAVII
jgi:hypothetical protein